MDTVRSFKFGKCFEEPIIVTIWLDVGFERNELETILSIWATAKRWMVHPLLKWKRLVTEFI